MQPTTHTSGFNIKVLAPMTKKKYIDLCIFIDIKLNEYYNLTDEKIYILPEKITEGGLYFEGNNYGTFSSGKWYKCMRHTLSSIKWPMIRHNVVEEWSNSDEVLFPLKATGSTTLKAYNGAPVWTLDELKILKECFEIFDIKCTKMPLKRNLITYR